VFGAHLPELLIVLILALVVFGPRRLPEIGGALGKGIREFRRGTSDLTGTDQDKPQIPDATVEPRVTRAAPVEPEVVRQAPQQETPASTNPDQPVH
jgi:TatA/E family protein of Tat protein translocase